MPTNKIIVTGSGKCGTSYFMKLLSELGFDTGFDPTDPSTSHGYTGDKPYKGFEWTIRGKHACRKEGQPRIIKDPYLCLDLMERAEKWDWDIEHVYILLRDYKDVANHQWHFRRDKSTSATEEDCKGDYELKAAKFVGNIVSTVITESIPYTFLMFPRIVTDPQYLYDNLKHTLPDVGPYDRFLQAFNKIADIKQIHFGEL